MESTSSHSSSKLSFYFYALATSLGTENKTITNNDIVLRVSRTSLNILNTRTNRTSTKMVKAMHLTYLGLDFNTIQNAALQGSRDNSLGNTGFSDTEISLSFLENLQGNGDSIISISDHIARHGPETSTLILGFESLSGNETVYPNVKTISNILNNIKEKSPEVENFLNSLSKYEPVQTSKNSNFESVENPSNLNNLISCEDSNLLNVNPLSSTIYCANNEDIVVPSRPKKIPSVKSVKHKSKVNEMKSQGGVKNHRASPSHQVSKNSKPQSNGEVEMPFPSWTFTPIPVPGSRGNSSASPSNPTECEGFIRRGSPQWKELRANTIKYEGFDPFKDEPN